MSSAKPHDFDVAIIGSGIAGNILGAILAKNGLNILVLDAGVHPRFAVGESMIPESGILLNLLAEHYNIPELRYPANLDSLIHKIGSSSAGIKFSLSPSRGTTSTSRMTRPISFPRRY
ncbi:NAD(P)-binding protein [Breoghania sp.]|uniref:NAD(P)-binding protein n=1 Tax=Breoghania sp. TaxID=2065378 RepID=UPI00263129EF|nr:NAD(P)-binding protein [Breoghania sp.]MDJ0933514.1 tryptophan 7-halogenase [Breoghania sp.]